MKKLIFVAALAACSVVAHADGFYCGPDFTVRAEITIPIDAADVGRPGAVYVGGRQYDGGDYSIGFYTQSGAWVPPADGSNALVAYQSFDGGLPSSIAISNICIPGLVFNGDIDHVSWTFGCVQDTALGGAAGDQLMYSYGALSIAAQQQIQQRIQAMTQAKAVLEPLGKWPNPPIDLDYQKQAQEAIAANAMQRANAKMAADLVVPYMSCLPFQDGGGN